MDAKTFITDYREGDNIFFQFLFFFGFEDLEITHGSGKTFIEADTPNGQLQIELNGIHNLDEGDFTFVIEND